MYKIGENEVVLCPYNRSHVVSKLRIQKHIIKCKNRYPEVKLITCFYNYTHKLKPDDVLKHYEICSQKIRMEEARYCESDQYISCYSPRIKDIYNYGNNEKVSLVSTQKTNSVKKDSIQGLRRKTIGSQNQSLNGVDGDDEDLRPLNLPKTVSKAFTSAKQHTEKSDAVHTMKPGLFQSGGFGRGARFFIRSPNHPLKANDHLLPNVSDMNNELSKKIKSRSKCFSNNGPEVGNSCSASVISSLFDDGNTLKSDDITFDDDDEENDGFIFKNFDKYVKV